MPTTSATINVSGMSCGHCVNAVTIEVAAIDGIVSVDVDLEAGTVTYAADQPISDAAIAAAIDEAGFEIGATS